MIRAQFLLVILIIVAAALPTFASEEGLLIFDTFQVSSPGIGPSGPVRVSGEQDSKHIISLTINAFGRTVSLSFDRFHVWSDEDPTYLTK